MAFDFSICVENIGHDLFRKALQGFCSHVLSCESRFLSQASKQRNGYVYIIDQRTHDPYGQVPPDDVIGAFEVKDGELTNYKPNPNYSIESENGFVDFGSTLNSEFEKYMERLLLSAK